MSEVMRFSMIAEEMDMIESILHPTIWMTEQVYLVTNLLNTLLPISHFHQLPYLALIKHMFIHKRWKWNNKSRTNIPST